MTGKDTDGSPAQEAPLADAKAKMREALERKNAGHHRSAEGARNTGSVHGAGGVGEAKRTFRPRKTG